MLPIHCKLFNLILNTGIIPEAWSKGTILPIYKNKGDINDPDNNRGITILSYFGKKLFTAVLNQRLNRYLESTGLLIEEQANSESIITGAQLCHNDFGIFADPSLSFTYNCDETFKTTSLTLSVNMPGHA